MTIADTYKVRLVAVDGTPLLLANSESELLASAARTADTSTPEQVNSAYKGVLLLLRITAVSGTGGLILRLETREEGGSTWAVMSNNYTAITATGLHVFVMYPGGSSAPAGAVAFSGVLPYRWRVRVQHSDGSSYTYSLRAVLLS